MILDEALLTPEDVSREFETQSAEIKLASRLSGTTQETILFIIIMALPTLPLNLKTGSEGFSSIVPGPSLNAPPAGSSLQQLNKPGILTKSPVLPEICLNLYCFKVDSSLKTVLTDASTLKISDNQITETSLLDKDSKPGIIRSKGLQESTKCKAN